MATFNLPLPGVDENWSGGDDTDVTRRRGQSQVKNALANLSPWDTAKFTPTSSGKVLGGDTPNNVSDAEMEQNAKKANPFQGTSQTATPRPAQAGDDSGRPFNPNPSLLKPGEQQEGPPNSGQPRVFSPNPVSQVSSQISGELAKNNAQRDALMKPMTGKQKIFNLLAMAAPVVAGGVFGGLPGAAGAAGGVTNFENTQNANKQKTFQLLTGENDRLTGIQERAAQAQNEDEYKREALGLMKRPEVQQTPDGPIQYNTQKGMWEPITVNGQPVKGPPKTFNLNPEEQTMNDLLKGDNGNPRINPDTQKPYSYMEAFRAVKSAGQDAKTPPLSADTVTARNAALSDRWQVLNPGKTLPKQYTLPANATEKDYATVDKSLEQLEKATGTKAQQDAAAAARRQAESDRTDKEGIQAVVGTDANGREVIASSADAKSLGLTGVMKADADMVNKAHAARTWLKLATKTAPDNSPADQMGIMQLIDKLDKKGELGVVASRWNDFLAGKVGADDPDYAALRAKMGLSSTKMMQAHVGSRGGAFMLEHFEDLANAGKMDGPTLRSGVASELDYMKDVAALPAPKTFPLPGKGGNGTPAPQTHTWSLGAWKKANPNGDANAAKSAAQAQGFTVTD